MANPLKGEASFTVDDVVYTLRLDLNCLIEVEDATGKPVEELFREVADTTKPRLKLLRTLFHAALQAHHPAMSLADAGRLMTDAGLATVYEAFSSVAARSFPKDDEAGTGGAAAIPQTAGDGTGQDSSAKES